MIIIAAEYSNSTKNIYISSYGSTRFFVYMYTGSCYLGYFYVKSSCSKDSPTLLDYCKNQPSADPRHSINAYVSSISKSATFNRYTFFEYS